MSSRNLGKLTFSGKPEDFPCFMEQFEARIFTLNLNKVLDGKVKTPEVKDGETPDEKTAREAAEEALGGLQHQVWAELVQCLDRKSIMFIWSHKPNGAAA